jgi:nucleotide-binding universal stress UspA family protein
MAADTPHIDRMRFRNILVALDASSHSMAALETAARLAERLEAELHGLFIEESDWFALSKLPTTSEVSELTGTLRRMEEGDMERHVMSLASRLRQAIEDKARRHHIQHRFETKRGQVEQELLQAAQDADLITLGRIGHSVWGGVSLGKTARTLIQESKTPVLILQQGLRLGGAITVLYQQGQDTKSLRLALELAQRLGVGIHVLHFIEEADTEDSQMADLRQQCSEQEIAHKIHNIQSMHTHQLVHVIGQLKSGMVIGDRSLGFMQNHYLEQLLSGISCPVLLT